MATTIVTKKGSGAPAASDLVEGELAVDTTNGRLYTENSSAAVVELGSNPSGNITFGDNGKAIFGAGSDLQIYHDASHSYIVDAGTGNMYLSTNGNGIVMQASLSETMFSALPNGSVRLYYDNAEKLSTTASGIDVTGSVTTTGSVGIGTSSPSGAYAQPSLHIHATGTGAELHLTDGTTGATSSDGMSIFQYGNDGYIHMRENGSLRTYINGSERMRIDASGNVGIGTTPVYDFDILDTSETILGIRASDSSGTNVAIRFQDAGTGTGVNGLYVGRASALNYFWTYEAEPLLFGTSATERMRIDSSGNVGIGVSASLQGKLNVGGDLGGDPSMYVFGSRGAADNLPAGHLTFRNVANGVGDVNLSRIQSLTGTGSNQTQKGQLAFSTNDGSSLAERLRIDASGNVNIYGTDNRPLAITSFNTASAGAGWDLDATSTNGVVTVSTGGAERMRIDSSGTIRTTSSDGTAPTVGSGCVSVQGRSNSASVGILRLYKTGDDGNIVDFYRTGNTLVGKISVSATTTSYVTSSDYRLKENVVAISGATERLKQLKPSRFNFIADADTTVDGFLAHEVQGIVPEAITGTKDAVDADGNPEYQGIDQSKLVPLLVATIQELEARITALES